MTREEIEKHRQYQLTDAAIDYCRKEFPHYDGEALGEIIDTFEAGAEWEHKRLVDMACEWLLNNAHLYVYAITKEKRALMFDNFKKAMEK